MQMKKPLLLVGAVTTIGVAGLGSASFASAETGSSSTNLVDKIAQKFNLNKNDVQAVFDQDKAAHEAEMQADQSERLQKAVDDGSITSGQKTTIEAKQKELQAARDKERTDLETWASQNKIDAKYLRFGGGHMGSDDRLQDAVDNGDLTDAQKKLIEAKQDELEKKRDTEREALQNWAKDNNIDMKYVMGFGGHMHGGHGGMGRQ
jgi:hypothetical protein